jgi:hypothetical protein
MWGWSGSRAGSDRISFEAFDIQLNDAKNSSKSLATVISPTRRQFPELKPEFLDGAQPGFNGLLSPVFFVRQRPRRILEVKNADAMLLHNANIVIHLTIFNRRKRVRGSCRPRRTDPMRINIIQIMNNQTTIRTR